MGNGTAIARHTAAGTAVHLVCATRGGAGWNGLPVGRRVEELPEIRAAELERAAAVLGLAGVELWDYPDGDVGGCDQGEIAGRIREAVDRLDPDLVYGWGPDGGYGHPDHIAVGACTDAALEGSGRAHYHMAVDDAYAAALGGWIKRFDPSSAVTFAPVERTDLVFEPSGAELDLVRRAIECHASQLSPLWRTMIDEESAFRWLARNCYVRVGAAPANGGTRSL